MLDTNEEYLKLITSEHYNKQDFIQYVLSFLDMVSPSVDILNEFETIFNLEDAVGDQLDKLGNLVGISRELPKEIEDVPSILSDASYRKVIKSRIFMNHWNGTREELEVILSNIFPDLPYEIVDDQNMEYAVSIVDPTLDDESRALIENGFILPKPSGVKCTYNILDSGLFGWDSDSVFIKGWDQGTWSSN